MKPVYLFFVLIAALLVPGRLCPESSGSEHLKEFETLVGEWENISNGATYTETWKLGPCGNLEGKAVMKNRKGKIVLTETLEIRKIGRHIVYIAGVNNSPPVLFTLKSEDDAHAKAARWAFENPEHDFPQRIVYRMESKDTLHARVEGMQKGTFTKEEFRLNRKRR